MFHFLFYRCSQTDPLDSAASNRTTVPAYDNDNDEIIIIIHARGALVGYRLAEKTEVFGEELLEFHFVNYKFHRLPEK
jgi:hypothetical protein